MQRTPTSCYDVFSGRIKPLESISSRYGHRQTLFWYAQPGLHRSGIGPMTYKPPYSVPEILKMRGEGMTLRQIGLRVGVSASRVGQLIQASGKSARLAARASVIREELRTANDGSRKVPVEDVLCLLDLSGKARDRLRKWCEWEAITELSLFDLMDMLLPVVEHPRGLYDLMPAYKVHGLGQKIYAELIKAVTALDCGDACQTEWTVRKERLKDYLRGQGGFYPYILHGRAAALLR